MKIVFSHEEICRVIQSGLRDPYPDKLGLEVDKGQHKVVGVRLVGDQLEMEVELLQVMPEEPSAD